MMLHAAVRRLLLTAVMPLALAAIAEAQALRSAHCSSNDDDDHDR